MWNKLPFSLLIFCSEATSQREIFKVIHACFMTLQIHHWFLVFSSQFIAQLDDENIDVWVKQWNWAQYVFNSGSIELDPVQMFKFWSTFLKNLVWEFCPFQILGDGDTQEHILFITCRLSQLCCNAEYNDVISIFHNFYRGVHKS